MDPASSESERTVVAVPKFEVGAPELAYVSASRLPVVTRAEAMLCTAGRSSLFEVHAANAKRDREASDWKRNARGMSPPSSASGECEWRVRVERAGEQRDHD